MSPNGKIAVLNARASSMFKKGDKYCIYIKVGNTHDNTIALELSDEEAEYLWGTDLVLYIVPKRLARV